MNPGKKECKCDDGFGAKDCSLVSTALEFGKTVEQEPAAFERTLFQLPTPTGVQHTTAPLHQLGAAAAHRPLGASWSARLGCLGCKHAVHGSPSGCNGWRAPSAPQRRC